MFDWTKSCSYDAQQKRRFHSTARSRLKKLAAELHLPAGSYDLRFNKAGIAVSGEVTPARAARTIPAEPTTSSRSPCSTTFRRSPRPSAPSPIRETSRNSRKKCKRIPDYYSLAVPLGFAQAPRPLWLSLHRKRSAQSSAAHRCFCSSGFSTTGLARSFRNFRKSGNPFSGHSFARHGLMPYSRLRFLLQAMKAR